MPEIQDSHTYTRKHPNINAQEKDTFTSFHTCKDTGIRWEYTRHIISNKMSWKSSHVFRFSERMCMEFFC